MGVLANEVCPYSWHHKFIEECVGLESQEPGRFGMIQLNFLPPLGVSLRYGENERARANMFSNMPAGKKPWQLIRRKIHIYQLPCSFLLVRGIKLKSTSQIRMSYARNWVKTWRTLLYSPCTQHYEITHIKRD